MTSRRNLIRGLGLGASAIAVVLTGLAADAPPQTVDAQGLTFQAPASWKSTKPRNPAMRRAQLTVEPAKGDEDPAELVVFAFPGGGGTAEANIKRWQGFFKDKEGNAPKAETKTVKGKNVDVIRVETAGRYVAPVFPGSQETHDKPNYRLLGAIVQTEGTGFYLRMIGPDKTMVAAKPAFDELLASIKVDEK